MKRRETSDGSGAQTLSQRLSDWCELVGRCGRKPGRKRVHALRVATLRIQAEVEDQLSDLPCASHEAQAILRFGKLADKLRDALGSVRELDVWGGKLQDLYRTLCETREYVPRSTRDTAGQIERLGGRLAKKRERAAEKLTKEIAKRNLDLLSAARNVEKAAGAQVDEADGEQSSRLLKEFSGIMAEFRTFDEGNLHDFRKRIKKIRYVAEIHSADPVCGQIAAHVKEAQSAIGEWHDWQVLARTAGRGKHAKDAGAVELLSSRTVEAFNAAIATCEDVCAGMAELQRDSDAGSPAIRKEPVREKVAAGAPARELA